MTTEQRRALADTTPTTEVIRDAVTYPRDRLGEPLDIDGARFDAWLAQVKREAARAERARIVSEVRLWASVNQQLGEGEEASRLRAVAGDIERLPEDVTP